MTPKNPKMFLKKIEYDFHYLPSIRFFVVSPVVFPTIRCASARVPKALPPPTSRPRPRPHLIPALWGLALCRQLHRWTWRVDLIPRCSKKCMYLPTFFAEISGKSRWIFHTWYIWDVRIYYLNMIHKCCGFRRNGNVILSHNLSMFSG